MLPLVTLVLAMSPNPAPVAEPVSDFTEKVKVIRIARGPNAEVTYADVPAARRDIKDVPAWWLQSKHMVGGKLAPGDFIVEPDGTKWEVTKATKGGLKGVPAWLCYATKVAAPTPAKKSKKR